MHRDTNPHFEGKNVFEHLRKTRMRGALASAEIHGVELSGFRFALLDSAKELTLLLVLTTIILSYFKHSLGSILLGLSLLSFGFILWRTGRCALLGWERLERLHRLIEEERWEIEHKRAQEREELKELYEAKGFKGEQLEEIINVLMADDNRLLRVMLEEEFGLSLESFEHPLKQAWGALLGATSATATILLSLYFFPIWIAYLTGGLILAFTSFFSAHFQKNRKIEAVIWQLSISGFACAATYFLMQVFVA